MARVMALTLAITAVVATLVASVLPLGLARLGADPGPCQRTFCHCVASYPERGDLSQYHYCNDGSALVIMRMT